jgi:hypothetical protein
MRCDAGLQHKEMATGVDLEVGSISGMGRSLVSCLVDFQSKTGLGVRKRGGLIISQYRSSIGGVTKDKKLL